MGCFFSSPPDAPLPLSSHTPYPTPSITHNPISSQHHNVPPKPPPKPNTNGLPKGWTRQFEGSEVWYVDPDGNSHWEIPTDFNDNSGAVDSAEIAARTASERAAAERAAAERAAAERAAAERAAAERAAAERATTEAAERAERTAAPIFFTSTVTSEWTQSNATGYERLSLAPQYRLRVSSAVRRAVVTLQHLPLTSYTETCYGVAVLNANGLRVSDPNAEPRITFSKFTNNAVSMELELAANTPYTIVATTFDGNGRGAFKVDIVDGETNAPLALSEPLALLGAETVEAHEAAEAVAVASTRNSNEHARRAAALAAMRAEADASPNGSQARADWVDFCAATAAVERLRADVRRRGGRYSDGWSGPSAVGAGWEEGSAAVWKDVRECAPFPVVVEDGFALADVQQGALGDCYFIACLADLVVDLTVSPLALDSVFVTSELNDEGVFCVRLWANEKWNWYFLDGMLPTKPDVYVDPITPAKIWAGAPDPAAGRFARTIAVRSTSINEFWPCFLEKAWAKMHGSYAAIDGGRIHDSDALSSFPLSRFLPHTLPGIHSRTSDDADEQWAALEKYSARNWLMTLGAKDFKAGERAASGTNGADSDGIVRNHAFSLLRLFSLVRPGEAQPLRLIEMRNPHGKGEWTGAYSDGDTKAWTPSLRAATGYDPEAGGDDGIFWMDFGSFRNKFESVSVTPVIRLVNGGGVWRKARVRGAFHQTPADSGFSAQVSSTHFFIVAHARTEFHLLVTPDDEGVSEVVNVYAHCRTNGSVDTPVADDEFSHYPGEPPRVAAARGFAGTGLANAIVTHDPSAGVLVVCVDLRGQSRLLGRAYTLSVCAETEFDLLVATPGSGVAAPVLKVSDVAPGPPARLPTLA